MRLLALGAVVSVTLLGAGLLAQTFKSGVRTVAVYATVTDTDGRLVPDLEQDAFEIEDEGKQQDITVFANDIQPITVVMLIDRSGSMEVIEILRTQLQERGPTPLWNAINVGITALLHEEGRRVILVFTDGSDFPMNFRTNNSTLKDVIKRADEENVMVYAIGFAGQMAPMFGARGTYSASGRGMPAMTPPVMPVGKPDAGLATLAGETGGGYFEVTKMTDLAASFKRVADELHHQYVIGFAPTLLDGKTHHLVVKVKGGLTVRARRTYLATREQ
jgi:hypothetical protein